MFAHRRVRNSDFNIKIDPKQQVTFQYQYSIQTPRQKNSFQYQELIQSTCQNHVEMNSFISDDIIKYNTKRDLNRYVSCTSILTFNSNKTQQTPVKS